MGVRAIPIALLTATLASGCHHEPPSDPAGPASEDFKTPPCVYFKELRPFLPAALPGYTTARDEGSTGKYGDVSVSEAERVFARDERELAVRIVDTTLSNRLGEKIKAAANDAKARPESDPTAPLVLHETVGFVRYDRAQAKAEANLLVADRFVVAVTGKGFESTAEVREVARNLDLAGLSKLR